MLSPLRYPGGKSDFASTALSIVQALELKNPELIEPFAGSAIVSLSLLDAGAIERVTLIERDPLVYSLWKAVFCHLDELLERFWSLPITLETWKSLRPTLKIAEPNKANIVDLALACLFFNRANFSGILAAGPIGGMEQRSKYAIDCRTNKDEITVRLLAAAAFSENVDVKFGDALAILPKLGLNSNKILYVDPPYFEKGELLYRHSYKLGDHRRLAETLKGLQTPWFLSYDVNHVIEYLYEDRIINKLTFRYSARGARNHEELLISNFLINPDVLGDLVRPARQLHLPNGRLFSAAERPGTRAVS